ncbi:MAG: hypothetical protein WBO70_02265 [Erysipelotrichaceae bacterium]
MTKRERENLKNEILMKNTMTDKIKTWWKISLLLFVLTLTLTIWGFFNIQDPILKVSDSTRNIIKWISLIVCVPSGVFGGLTYFSYRNAKKHILGLINKLDAK